MYVSKSQIEKAKTEWLATYNDDDEPENAFRDDYSGRYMYGRTCIGITSHTSSEAIKFLFALAEVVYPEDWHCQRDAVIDLIEGMRSDSMGLSMIWYFPDLVVEDDSPIDYDDEDEDDEGN